jgi:glutamine synthetase
VADPKNREEVRSRAAADGIEFFFAQFVDMHGKPSAKLVPAERLDMLFDDGAGFAGFAAGPIGQSPASPDIAAIPDPESYTPVPFKPGLARFACDITIDGAPYNFCPRTILKNATARAEKMGYRLKMGMELEFFLLKERDGKIVLADDLDTLEQPCYDMKGITRSYDFITQLSKNMNGLGWGNYANDHEDANGQFELNFEYDDALRTADKAIFFRYMVHAMAQERGLLTTFMPKPFSNLTGNGGHLHISLWDPTGKINLFEDRQDPRGLGLSPLAYEFLGGIIDNSDGLSAILAPTVNSYKRIGVGAPTSGATWAPAYATYGMNNRTQSIRIPAPSRSARPTAQPTRISRPLPSSAVVSMALPRRPAQASLTSTTSTSCRLRRSSASASRHCPPTYSTLFVPPRRTRPCATGSARWTAERTWTISPRSKWPSGRSTTRPLAIGNCAVT